MTTTPERNARRHHVAAILAIGEHLVEHQLPAPSSITLDDDDVTVWIMVHDLRAWLATVTLEEATTDPRPATPPG